MRRRAALGAGAALLGWYAGAAAEPRYRTAAAAVDGTGRFYLGREIAPVMGWQGAAWLEREEREREERTSLLIAALELRPGMVVADVGAGTGYVSRRIAAAVGPGGRVDAVDVQPEMLRLLADSAKREGLGNIAPVLGSETDVRLAPASVDLALMVDVYHELSQPYEVLASIVKALKPGGAIVFVEYRAEDPAVPIKTLHKMSLAQIDREATVFALRRDRIVETLPWQHVVFYRRTSR